MSDTHNQPIPRFRGDVLLHAGDMTIRGTEAELTAAAEELAGYPCRQIIVVPGNHDILFESDEARARAIFESREIKVLMHQGTEVGGVKIWGAPGQKECWGAFGYNMYDSYPRWDDIPTDTDILLTHSPASYTLDRAPNGEHLGCPALSRALTRVAPSYHVFGHIHSDQGFSAGPSGIVSINAAICSERYDVLNPPIAFNLGLPGSYERW